jgi:ferritin-like metal-binding protein YciE
LIGSTLVAGDPHYFSRAIITADKNLNDLCLDTLREIYYAEKQICKSLPKMAKAAQSDELRAAFEKRHGEPKARFSGLSKSSNCSTNRPRQKVRRDRGIPR